MERKESEHPIKHLTALSKSNFEIKDGQPDITHWKVLNSARQYIGTVNDLLFDEEAQKVRYIILNLEGNTWKMKEREVLVPVGVAELDLAHTFVILPYITASQIDILPDYTPGNPILSAASEWYDHSDFNTELYTSQSTGSYEDHIPFQIITRIYQEENEAENAFSLLMTNGIEESNIKVTPYNPINSVTDLQGNTNTEFIGDGSRDEYILSVAASSEDQARLVYSLLD